MKEPTITNNITQPIPVVVLGAGSHAKIVIEILQKNQHFDLVGLLDKNPALVGENIFGVPIVGNDDRLLQMQNKGVVHFAIGIAGTGYTGNRQKLYEYAINCGMQPINTIHEETIISPSVQFNNGITISGGVIINAGASVGTNVLINTGAIVEHDCIVGNHVHIATGARIAGAVTIGAGTHIGIGATVKQCLTIGDNVIVGAGAVVIDNIPSNVMVVGVPACTIASTT